MHLLPKKNTFFIEKWEIDPLHNTIRNGSKSYELEPKAMQVLEYLAKYAGQTVHRDVLFKAFWPNQTVTEEALTRVISRLRQCFADAPKSPNYIITIRNTGYRMIAKVSGGNYFSNRDVDHLPNANVASHLTPKKEFQKPMNPVGKVATFSIAVGLVYFIFNQPVITDTSKIQTKYVTSELGEEMSPAISPDGENVAYTKWISSMGSYDNSKVGVLLKNISDNTVEHISHPEGLPSHTIWSPDSRKVAFVNEYDNKMGGIEHGIYSTDIITGKYEKITKTSTHNHGLSWSPDGRYIVYPDGSKDNKIRYLYRYDIETGQRLRIAPYDTQNTYVTYSYPKYSPSGDHIAVIRTDRGSYDSIDLIDTKNYSSKRVYSSETGISSIEWKDNNTLFVSDGATVSSLLFELSVNNGVIKYIDISNKDIEYLSYSAKSNRLIFENIDQPYNIYSTDFTDDLYPLDFTPFTQSNKQELEASQSPDKKKTAIISTRSGAFEIWLKNNSNNQTQRITTLDASSIKGLDWSPDNKRLAFIATTNHENGLYWVDVETKNIDAFSHDKSRYSLIGWDSNNTLLFSSNYNYNWKLWRIDADKKALELMMNEPVSHGRLSPDRKTLYYVKYNHSSIWKTNIKFVDPVQVSGTENIGISKSWTVTDKGLLYFMLGDTEKYDKLYFLDFATSKTKRAASISYVYLNRIYWNGGRLFYSLYERRESDIALVENL